MYEIIDKLINLDMPCRYQQLGDNEVNVIGIFITDGGMDRALNWDIRYKECLCNIQFQLKDNISKGFDICEKISSLDGLHSLNYGTHKILGIELRNHQHYVGLTDKGVHLFNVEFLITYK